jgi:hypothetical protein
MYSTLRDYRFNKDVDDLRGSALYGPDEEKLGKIGDVVFDSDSAQVRYFIIDTGGWLKSRRFLVPPDQVHSSTKDPNNLVTNLTKSQIEQFPALDEEVLEDQAKFQNYEKSYRSSWPSSVESPLSPRFLKFQDEIVRNRSDICAGPKGTEPMRKVG